MGIKNVIFRSADGADKLLMFFGSLGSIGDGMQYPLTMFVLSDVINDYGNSNTVSLSNHTVDMVYTCSFISIVPDMCVCI